MKTKLEQEYYMRALDVDIKGDWMPSAIFVRMQEIAEDHATAVGAGRVQIVDKLGLAWVLTRGHLQMHRYPKIGQTIKVATWPTPPTKLTFLRQFEFSDLEGNVLGCASSQWVLFDIKERVLRRTNALGIEGGYPVDPSLGERLADPTKIRMPEGMEHACRRKVMYSDVDMNGHMNNVKYANWICEVFDPAWLREKSMRNMKINFVAEAYLDQDVDISMAEKDGGYFICGKTDGKTVFDSYIDWM